MSIESSSKPMSPEQLQMQSQGFHSSYPSSDGNLTLVSSDQVKFRVHTFILQIASGFFSNMLKDAIDTGDAIPLEEDSEVLKALLDMIYPSGPFVKIRSFDSTWRLLCAAEKYEIKKPLEEVRGRLLSEPYFRDHPLEAYALASRFGWKQESILTSSLTLGTNINSIPSLRILSLLPTPSVLILQRLHNRRKEILCDVLRHTLDYFTSVSDKMKTIIFLMTLEIAECPSGFSFEGNGGFWERPEVASRLPDSISRMDFLDAFRETMNVLPRTIADVNIDVGQDIR